MKAHAGLWREAVEEKGLHWISLPMYLIHDELWEEMCNLWKYSEVPRPFPARTRNNNVRMSMLFFALYFASETRYEHLDFNRLEV